MHTERVVETATAYLMIAFGFTIGLLLATLVAIAEGAVESTVAQPYATALLGGLVVATFAGAVAITVMDTRTE